MKKTVTTMLSFALALILVSSLSSGVILAKGDDHDNRKKNKNKYETVREFAILDCISSPIALGVPVMFSFFDGPADVATDISTGMSCAENVAVVLDARFKLEGVDTAIFSGGPGASLSRHTFMRSKRVLIAP